MSIFISFILLFFSGLLLGQSYQSTDAYTLSRANISSLPGASIGAFTNPSVLQKGNYGLGLFVNNQYGLNELSSLGAYGRKNIGNAQINGGLSVFGSSNFQERRLNAGYALQVEQNLRFGVALNAYQYIFREREANQSILTFSPGLQYLYKRFVFGFFAQNIGVGSQSQNYVQEALSLGMSYTNGKVGVFAEIEKYSNRPLLTKIALDYAFNEKLSFIYGASFGVFNQHIGIGFMLKDIRFDLSFFYQNRLGLSSAFGGSYFQ